MKTNAKTTILPTLSILLAGACWGVIGLWSMQLLSAGLSPQSVVAVRNCGGLIFLVAIFAIKDPSVFVIDWRDAKYFFGTGIISVLLFTLCSFTCQQLASLSVSAILLYTAPSIVVVLSAILWKEPITKRKALALAMTFFGAACVSGVITGELVAPLTGILFGVGAGFFYALYSIFGRYALEKYPPMTVTVWTFIFCGIGALFFVNPQELTAVLSQGYNGFLALGLVVISTVLPYIFYTYGLAQVEAGKASILASVEPVVACCVGVIVFGESVSIWTVIGIMAVIGGVYCLKEG